MCQYHETSESCQACVKSCVETTIANPTSHNPVQECSANPQNGESKPYTLRSDTKVLLFTSGMGQARGSQAAAEKRPANIYFQYTV